MCSSPKAEEIPLDTKVTAEIENFSSVSIILDVTNYIVFILGS